MKQKKYVYFRISLFPTIFTIPFYGGLNKPSTSLLLIDLDHIILLHLQGLRVLVVIDSPAIEEEPEAGNGHAHPLAVALLQLPHLRGLLDPEVDLIAVLANHLQLDVLAVVTRHHGDWRMKVEKLGLELSPRLEGEC